MSDSHQHDTKEVNSIEITAAELVTKGITIFPGVEYEITIIPTPVPPSR